MLKWRTNKSPSKKNHLLLYTLPLLLFACNNNIQTDAVSEFHSNWMNEVSLERNWAGPEYWLNPLQAWSQKEGRLEVVSSGGDRNCVLLTHSMGDQGDAFDMKVTIDKTSGTDSTGWVGFQIGLQGAFHDFRDDAVHGRGFCAGASEDGYLFIGNTKHAIPDYYKADRFQLELSGKLISHNLYSINLSYHHPIHNTSQTIQTNVHGSWLEGLLAIGSSTTLPEHLSLKAERPPFQQIPALSKNAAAGNLYAFSNWSVTGPKVEAHPERAYGPILWTQYTLSDNVLNMSVQMAPIGNDAKKTVLLIDGHTYEGEIDSTGCNVLYQITEWDTSRDHPFQVIYSSNNKKQYNWEGVIVKEPVVDQIKVASLSCVDDRGFPHQDLVGHVLDHDPDLFIFHGDQIYERVGGYGVERSSTLDYLRKWYIWGWSFRDCIRNKPAIIIPDDHDVYHGNLWGMGGKRANTALGWGYDSQDDGGYKEPPAFVNMVHRTQTGHLPDPVDPRPVLNDISVYFTNLDYAGISFAILSDRQWKSAPKYLLPKAKIENGWPQNKTWDAKTEAFHPDAELLGERQEIFLEEWVKDWGTNVHFKTVVSQSPFCNVATLPKDLYHDKHVPNLPRYKKGEYPPDDRPVADFDSNGWPQNKRNKAIRTIRKAFAIHLTGDQHLGSTGQYGVDAYGDGNYWVSTPAVSNLWPRRWFPAAASASGPLTDQPRYTGDYEDGFGNKITVAAIANPYDIEREPERVFDKAPGYTIITFDKKTRNIEAAVWPRWSSPKEIPPNHLPFDGWPVTIAQDQNNGQVAKAYLPATSIEQGEYIQVFNESTKELIYAIRPVSTTFRAKVFDEKVKYKIVKIKNGNISETLEGLIPEK